MHSIDESEEVDFDSISLNVPSDESEGSYNEESSDFVEVNPSEDELITESELKLIAKKIRPIIRKRCKNWEKRSEFTFSEEIITNDGIKKVNKSRRDSVRYYEEEFDSNAVDQKLTRNPSFYETGNLNVIDYFGEDSVKVVKRVVTTTTVEEYIESVEPNDEFMPRNRLKRRSQEDLENTPKRPSPEKPKNDLPAIKGAEVVVYTPKGSKKKQNEIKVSAKSLQKIIAKKAIEAKVKADITLHGNTELVLTPGSKKKEIRNEAGGSDIFSQLKKLRRPILTERPVSQDKE